VADGRPRTLEAALLALLAALLWSSYYFFVLDLKARGVGDGPITAYPFLAGGLAYLAFSFWTGTAGTLRSLMRDWGAYARIGLLIAMQLLVLAATYGMGAVDTSLLTLVGDVVLTPILVVVLYREGAERFRSALFVVGVLLSTVGATLAILGGGSAQAIVGIQWAVALLLPLAVAVYFLWTARAGRRLPSAPLVTHATLGAALVVLAALTVLPGGIGVTDPLNLALLATNGLLSFFVGPLLYFRAIQLVGLILPSVLMATIPVFTLMLAILIQASFPPWLGAVGIPIAVLGAFLAMRGEMATAQEPSSAA
jgi:drug/metabolite transporter (DMT)-like permease